MFSQDELRDALARSASRADELPQPDAASRFAGPAGRTAAAMSPPGAPRRRRIMPVLTAAAAIAAVAAATVGIRTWLGDAADGSPVAQPGASSSVPSISAQTGVPVTPGARADVSSVLDVVDLAPDARMSAMYGLGPGPGVEEVRQPTGSDAGDPVLTIDVVSPAAGLDAQRIPRDRPVPIAGVTGFYSNLKLFPIDGSTGSGSDKWLPAWTIAYPHGDVWVFVWLQTAVDATSRTHSVDDPERIAHVYEQYPVTFGTSVARLPFRVGWLPEDATVQSGGFHRAAGSGAVETNGANISLALPGDRYIHIVVEFMVPTPSILCTGDPSAPDALSSPSPAGCGWAPISRQLGDGNFLVVSGAGIDNPTLQRVMDSITLADPSDPASFYTLAESLG